MTLMDEYYQRHDKPQTIDAPKQRLFALLSDFTDRRGLRQEWDQIDDEVKEEILQTWLNILSQ